MKSTPGTNPHHKSQREPVIHFRDVGKKYGSLEVLKSVSLRVDKGEVYGFLGRNGAGKSTAIKMLLGITRASSGTIDMFGQAISGNVISTRQRVGYVAQEQHFYPWMSPLQLGKFVQGMYPRWQQRQYRELLDLFELPTARKIGNFSGGMKARLALSLAVATGPECLILDEPTAGMDPVARREFLDLVSREARQTEATVFFSTHLIDEIESIADRIAIIESGKTVYEGGLQTLSKLIASYSIDESLYQPGSVPGECVYQGSWCLQKGVRNGKWFMIFEYQHEAPANPVLNPGWQQDSMTLEDTFVALVARTN